MQQEGRAATDYFRYSSFESASAVIRSICSAWSPTGKLGVFRAPEYNSGEKGRVVSMKKAPSSKSHRVEGRLQQDLLEFIHAVLSLRKAFVLYCRGNVMLAEALKKLRAAAEGVFYRQPGGPIQLGPPDRQTVCPE